MVDRNHRDAKLMLKATCNQEAISELCILPTLSKPLLSLGRLCRAAC